MPEEPITGAEFDRWAAQFFDAPYLADEALLAAGISAQSLRQWRRVSTAQVEPPPIIGWRLDRQRLEELFAAGRRAPLADLVTATRSGGREPTTDRPFLRLQVGGDAIPTAVIPRLLRNTVVDSAIVAAARPPGALKRRDWSWPLRIGFVGFDAASVRRAIRRTPDPPPAGQIDFRDVTVEPAALDILVAIGPLEQVARSIAASRQVTNAVIVLDDTTARWPVVEGQLAVLRAATAAVVIVLAPLPAADQPPHRQTAALARTLSQLISLMSLGAPFDVAVTAAFKNPIVVGEVEALQDDTDLGAILQRATADIRTSIRDWAPTVNLQHFERRLRPLSKIPRASWIRPTLNFDEFRPQLRSIRQAIEAALPSPPLRYLQCTVTPVATARASAKVNTVRGGPNEVSVFVGPAEPDALRGGAVSERALGFVGTDVAAARVTVVLAPLIPRGEPVSTELDVPRAGRSAHKALMWQLPTTMKRGAAVSARIVVVFRNRVLQTAVLSGAVGGNVGLKEQVLLRADWSNLNDRKSFDAAIVKNVDDDGHHTMILKVDDGVVMARLTLLSPITDAMGKLMVEAASIKGKAPKKRLTTLIKLAQKGFDYWTELQRVFRSAAAQLAVAQRVQLLTLESPRQLPLELAYTRVPPLDTATVCPSWEQGGQNCGPGCGTGENDQSIVCPAAFWGMSRVIERYYADVTGGDTPVVLQKSDPKANKRQLAVNSALVAASRVVRPTDTAETVRQLQSGTDLATSWDDWKAQLISGPAKNLLVLLAHNAPGPALEISGHNLERPMLLDSYVTGTRNDAINPVVLLFGCDTAGLAADPSGWSMRFLDRHAAVVFSTLTMLYGKDAAQMAQIISNLLRDPARGEQSVGTLTQQFRREAYRAGLISALGIASYGDTDWTVV